MLAYLRLLQGEYQDANQLAVCPDVCGKPLGLLEAGRASCAGVAAAGRATGQPAGDPIGATDAGAAGASDNAERQRAVERGPLQFRAGDRPVGHGSGSGAGVVGRASGSSAARGDVAGHGHRTRDGRAARDAATSSATAVEGSHAAGGDATGSDAADGGRLRHEQGRGSRQGDAAARRRAR